MKTRKKNNRSANTPASMQDLHESEVSLISQGSSFEGTLELDSFTRFHGKLKGRLAGKPGSLIVLAESGLVEGEIDGDTIWVDGFVRGEIRARTRILLSPSARVMGDLQAPSIEIQPGAFFDGSCKMEKR